MLSAAQEFVSYALAIQALELVPQGRRLKSGRISPYFFNSGRFTSGDAIHELAKAYAKSIHRLDTDVLYGPPYKGTLLVPAIAAALWTEHAIKVDWASSRKEAKDHGEGGLILGANVSGRNVLVVDDVITTGDTKAEALELIRSQGGNVVGVVIAFDRLEQVDDSDLTAAQQFSARHGVPVHSAANLDDLIAVLQEDTDYPGNSPELLNKILEYHSMYGID